MHAVLTLDDLAHGHGAAPHGAAFQFRHAARQGSGRSRWPTGEVSYVGEPVAHGARGQTATSPRTPPRWCEVDYESLPAVSDCRAARAAGAPAVRRELNTNIVATYKVAFGDVDGRLRQGRACVQEELWQHRGAAHSIEARGMLAELRDADGGITVHASTQKAHDLFQTLTSLLDFDESRLRVARPTSAAASAPSSASIPRTSPWWRRRSSLGRSIKWTEDRREYFTNAAQERDQYWSLEIAVDADAKVLGVRGKLVARHRRLHAAGPRTSPTIRPRR